MMFLEGWLHHPVVPQSSGTGHFPCRPCVGFRPRLALGNEMLGERCSPRRGSCSWHRGTLVVGPTFVFQLFSLSAKRCSYLRDVFPTVLYHRVERSVPLPHPYPHPPIGPGSFRTLLISFSESTGSLKEGFTAMRFQRFEVWPFPHTPPHG